MAETKMQLVDWLDDLCVRFIINLPQEELESVERICFQVEEAQWFYEDFVRPLDPTLPSMSLRQFCLLIFQHCPLLASFSEYHHMAAFEEFLAYKVRVPVRGAIMLNDTMDQVLLVKGWKKSASWSFPRGKINKDETDLDCAVREAYEETGFDLAAAGLVLPESKMKYIEVTMREQHMKLYVFQGVPQDVQFQPKTRKEISKIAWYPLISLPGYRKAKSQGQPEDQVALSANKLYMVAPFLQPLKKWVAKQRKAGAHGSVSNTRLASGQIYAQDSEYTGDEEFVSAQTHAHARSIPKQNAELVRNITQPTQSVEGSLASNRNAASELKKLLSVGQQASGRIPGSQTGSSQSNADHLISLLRKSSGQIPTLQTLPHPPHTPMEQVIVEQQEPQSPKRQQPGLPGLSTAAPPPTFPSRDLTKDRIEAGDPGQAPRVWPPAHSVSAQPTESMPAFHGQLPTFQSHLPPNTLPYPPPFASQAPPRPPPYQRTGDPEFARPLQTSAANVPSIPRASDLPKPNLSNHAMNLLNVFKGKTPQPTSPVELNAANHSRDTSMQNLPFPGTTPVTGPGPYTSHRHTESRSRQALMQSKSPATEVVSPQPPPAVNNAATSTRATTHQNSLLELFKAPTEAAAQEAATPVQQATLLPAPVELSAFPSPGLKSHNKFEGEMQPRAVPDVANYPRKSRGQTDANGSPQTPELTSATITAPPKLPELGSIRRKPRTSRPSSEQREKQQVQTQQAQPSPAPITILKRPQEVKTEITPSKTTDSTRADQSKQQTLPNIPAKPRSPQKTASPIELKGSTPVPAQTPFQPQILKRPQTQATSEATGTAAAVVEPANLSRRQSATEAQKSALLSLFNKPAKPAESQSPKVGRSPIVSPVSMDHPTRVRNSRFNSVTSETARAAAATEDPRLRMGNLLASAKNEPLRRGSGDERANGRQTPGPVSPSDKSFLLSYLEGVAKSAGQ